MTEHTETFDTATSTIHRAGIQGDTLAELRKTWDSYVAGLPGGYQAWRRGAAYVRDSSAAPSIHGSAAIQLTDILDRLARRQVWVAWEDVFVDLGPGSMADRSSLQALLAGVRDDRYTVVGAYGLDRLVRKPKDVEAVALELRMHDVELDCQGVVDLDLLSSMARWAGRCR